MSDFYKMDPSAWDFGTANLTLEQEAAYLRIVNATHKHRQPVPNNDRVLAGLFRCSMRKARALVDALIEAGKVRIEDGSIVNERAISDLVHRGFVSSSRAENGAKGGRNSAEKKRNKGEPNDKPLENIDTAQANAFARREEKRREEGSGGGGACAHPRESDPPEPTRQSEQPNLTEREQALVAMGHHPTGVTAVGRIVGSQADMAEMRRWSELGLTHDQQLGVIREVMAAKRDGPPVNFRYFTAAMQRLAGELARAPLVPATPAEPGPPALHALPGGRKEARMQHGTERLQAIITAAAVGTTQNPWG